MVIDNVNDIRAQWSAISDNVMGGISEVSFYEIQDTERNFYRLEGSRFFYSLSNCIDMFFVS